MDARANCGALLVSLLSIGASAHAGVLTVGASGQMFTAIQPAIDAAVDGDVILIRPGAYDGSVDVVGKDVDLVGDGAGVLIGPTARVSIRATSASATVIVSGLTVLPAFGTVGIAALTIDSCAGVVRCQDLVLRGAAHEPAALVLHSAQVSFARCTLRGSTGGFLGMVNVGPSAGLEASDSTVALYDCEVTGGDGPSGTPIGTGGGSVGPYPGAVALALDAASTCFSSGGAVRGGRGGAGLAARCFPQSIPGGGGAVGGDGLVLDATSYLDRLDVPISGGDGGPGGVADGSCGAPAGPAGSAGASTGGAIANVSTLSGAHRRLATQSPARELTNVTFDIGGQPGDRVLLITSARARHELYLPFQGVILYGAGVRRIALGMLPGSGALSFALPLADLGPGVESSTRCVQALFIDASNQATLSDPVTLVALDSMF